MKQLHSGLLGRYRRVLHAHLGRADVGTFKVARDFGERAMKDGLNILQLARVHDKTMSGELLSAFPLSVRVARIRKAGHFFAAVTTSMERGQIRDRKEAARLNRLIAALSHRTVQLTASKLELSLEVARRRAVEKALKTSELHYSILLKESARLQEQLRGLSRQILSAHEEERKKISRELHDVIAQTLTGISIRLATLKKDAAHDIQGLNVNISRTQKLVERSVNIVHRFARELRPAVLDDLGLAPALQSFIKNFTQQTKVPVALVLCSSLDRLDTATRTVLFRVAQEALTNVARHAEASQVRVTLRKTSRVIRLRIEDDGEAFCANQVMHSRSGRHLGLIGMRERMEMIGGHLEVDSFPGRGTRITADILLRPHPPLRAGNRSNRSS